MSESEPKLTKVERLILKNQFAILEFLSRAHPDLAQSGNIIYHDPDYYQRAQEVMQYGYERLQREVTDVIYDIDLTPEEQGEILDILQMYEDLQRGYEFLEDKNGMDEQTVAFPGWDGNSLKGELSFARVFCYRADESSFDGPKRTPSRFADVKPSPAHNSHFPVMDGYRRMLSTWRVIMRGDRFRMDPLTYDEIQTILQS